jgi:hypothetical protein
MVRETTSMGLVRTKGTCLLYVDSFVRGKGEISNFEFCSDRVFPMTLLELKGGGKRSSGQSFLRRMKWHQT